MARKSKTEIEARRTRLMRLLAVGITSPVKLANMLNVSRKTIYNDIQAVKERILEQFRVNPEELFVEIQTKYQARNEELWNIITQTNNDSVKLGAINSLMKNDEMRIKTLQSLGFLHREPEEVIISSNPLKEAIEEEIKKLKNAPND